jgi:hypothetical protein
MRRGPYYPDTVSREARRLLDAARAVRELDEVAAIIAAELRTDSARSGLQWTIEQARAYALFLASRLIAAGC